VIDEELFRHQVKYLGLLENVRVRRAGFCFRETFKHFLWRCVSFRTMWNVAMLFALLFSLLLSYSLFCSLILSFALLSSRLPRPEQCGGPALLRQTRCWRCAANNERTRYRILGQGKTFPKWTGTDKEGSLEVMKAMGINPKACVAPRRGCFVQKAANLAVPAACCVGVGWEGRRRNESPHTV
jgi:hypothetical protein